MKTKIEYRGFLIEFRAMLSNEESYFSQKRFASVFNFIAVLIVYLVWSGVNMMEMTATDFGISSGIMMAYGGYTTNQIQKEKKSNKEL